MCRRAQGTPLALWGEKDTEHASVWTTISTPAKKPMGTSCVKCKHFVKTKNFNRNQQYADVYREQKTYWFNAACHLKMVRVDNRRYPTKKQWLEHECAVRHQSSC